MKSFDSRVYSINDFVEWDKQGTLVLNPAFQRRPVWSDKAKSFLMDTIVRGKPIPKVFIRQKINPTTKTSVREVVDGQQRLRTILSFVRDGFEISKRHNKELGGKLFSQLPEDVQTELLGFEVSVDVLINLPNSEILDIFSRLNSYAVILNEQEKINADHFGPFKSLADQIGRDYYSYWLEQKIISDKQILRMAEVNLVADIIICMIEGIKAKKQIKRYYDTYEKDFPYNTDEIRTQFDSVASAIGKIFPDGLPSSHFNRVNLFYSLFAATFHCIYGLKNFDGPSPTLLDEKDFQRAKNGLDHVTFLIDMAAEGNEVDKEHLQFLKDIRLATTDEIVRVRRTKYLLDLM